MRIRPELGGCFQVGSLFSRFLFCTIIHVHLSICLSLLVFLAWGQWRGGARNVAVDTMIAFVPTLRRGTRQYSVYECSLGTVCNCRFV